MARETWHQEDALSRLDQAARTLIPAPIKSAVRRLYVKTPYSWRAGPSFRRTYGLLEQSQWWTEERIHDHQLTRLKEVLRHARKNVPGYGARFAEYGVDENAITSLDDIRRFPCLTKDDLRDNHDLYLARNIPQEHLQYVTSGGTTGTPTGFYHISRYNDGVADAFKLIMWKRIGYTPRCRALDLTASLGDGPLQYSAHRNLLYVSISSLDHESFPSYVDTIRSFRPQFVMGFPSTVTLFAQLVKDYGVSDMNVQGVITASEVFYETQRRYVTDILGCRTLDWYGMAEYAGFASRCEHSEQYHFSPEAGCMELLDAQGAPVTEEGKEGEIVLTGFYNWATPFIRYRTGDRAILGKRRCSACGRCYPLVERISGRMQEFLVARNGRLIPNTALNLHSDIFDDVLCYQFYQDTPGEIVLSIVRKPSYEVRRTECIRGEIERKLGDGTWLCIRFVEDIPKTSRGKHRFIVQKLPIKEGWADASAAPKSLTSTLAGCQADGPEAQ